MSEWGLGWRTSLAITRSRIVGDLDYVGDDLSSPWGQLIRGTDGFWYPLGMNKPIRVSWSGNTMIAYLPDGSTMTFGGATSVNGAKGVYSWPLVDVVSATKRRTHLEWTTNSSGRPYLVPRAESPAGLSAPLRGTASPPRPSSFSRGFTPNPAVAARAPSAAVESR